PGRGEALFDLVGDLSGKRALDVGCGLAPYREKLEQKGAKWTGLDLAGPACSVIGDGDHLPFCDGAFDVVLCASVLEHMPEPDKTILEIRRVLADRGKVFGYVSFLEPLHGLSYFHMSHLGLEHLLLKHGFRPVRIFPSLNGTAFQIECLLFPKYVPILQPIVRTMLQWSFEGLCWLNRMARKIVHHLQRRPSASDAEDRKNYRRLLSLRFAVGFNFVAERREVTDNAPLGYSKLVRQ
ncbi:MAG: class I SAM-dependent methyltransferase, partial [Candidatus Latescibacterota bacterium]